MMQRGKRILILLCTALLIFGMLPMVTSGASAGPSIVTTLTDNITQRGSKRTFDVWAKNASGAKIRATVKHNGKRLEPTWDDNEKASYTLTFTEEGENIVTVSASSDGGKKKELTYHITYIRAKDGEEIGRAIWSVETFSIGCGYLIEPTEVPIYEGETSAEQLLRLLSENGFVGYYGGTVKSSFYLAYIADGSVTNERYNNYQKSKSPSLPKKLNLSPSIPSMLYPYLEENMTFFDPDDYKKNWAGYLGEFAFTNGSGWMYSVNNVFPNVGFADCYLADGDTVRVQFTLGYGADIGGAAAIGTEIPGAGEQPAGGYYATANKDSLVLAIFKARSSGLLARTNVKAAYEKANSVMAKLNASQKEVDAIVKALYNALANPTDEAKTTESSKSDGKDTNPDSTKKSSDTKPEETKPVTTKSDKTTSSGKNPDETKPNTTDKIGKNDPKDSGNPDNRNDNSGMTDKDDLSASDSVIPDTTSNFDTDYDTDLNTDTNTKSTTERGSDDLDSAIMTDETSPSPDTDSSKTKTNTVVIISVSCVVIAAAAAFVIYRAKKPLKGKGKND